MKWIAVVLASFAGTLLSWSRADPLGAAAHSAASCGGQGDAPGGRSSGDNGLERDSVLLMRNMRS